MLKIMAKWFSSSQAFSEARRSFFLITIFDMTFMFLLWLIYCTTKGYSLTEAYENEIKNYDIDISMFDVVAFSVIRFLILCICYSFCNCIHWLPVAFITFTSSSFLIAKVILFAIHGSHKIITDYVILIISFVIAWIEVWFLELKVFSQERFIINALPATTQQNIQTNVERGYGSINRRPFSEIGSFYSPMDSPNQSDEEEQTQLLPGSNQTVPKNTAPNNEALTPSDFTNLSFNSQAKEYETLSKEMIDRALELYNKTSGWKMDKQFLENETPGEMANSIETRIFSQTFSKIGKVFKLESHLNFDLKLILNVLRDDVERYPEWNKTVKLTKILTRYSETLSIMYSEVHEQAGGIVAPRDFVNLSKYAVVNDLHVIAGSACVHQSMPPKEGLVRGENGPTAYFLKPINENTCKITWLLNVNLKGWLPQYIIDQSLSTVQTDFITLLRERLRKLTNLS